MGYSPRGRKESDTTERLHFQELRREHSPSPDGVAERRDHGRRWQKVALEHLRYILALSAWYCFFQSYDPSIHTIIQNVTF